MGATMKILIFGIGSDYEKYKKYFIDCEIVGLLDNNSKKIGSVKDGITIYNPAKGVERESLIKFSLHLLPILMK